MSVHRELEKFFEKKERQQNLDHRDVLLAIASIIKTDEGRKLFSYLFDTLEVTNLPDQDLDGKLLFESLGFLRAGNSIYKLVCESASETAASIIAELERKRYDDKRERYSIENGLATSSDDTED